MEHQNADSAPQTPGAINTQRIAETLEQTSERVFLKHVADKLRAGKTLTRQEQTRLSSLRHGTDSAVTFAANQSELADLLDVSRKTIQRALEKDGNPGAMPDGRYEVKPWRDYLSRTNEHLAESDKTSIRSERARNLSLKNDKLEFELAVLRRDYIAADDVEKLVGEMIAESKKVLNTGPSSLAPQVVGVSIAEAEQLIREWVVTALNQLHNDPLGKNTPAGGELTVNGRIVDESS